ncbi:polysaccharide biosynthesis tyrosine autokinase [Ramlibacter sp. AN1015]|uniref:polysaccharide biosynthesis tyrosine autokinase n=1 Tax=Ramlibacter sp. AN1015 TaxID=3133428 RepID=UPI0030C3E688
MNAPHPLQKTLATSVPPSMAAPLKDDDDEINLAEYWDIIIDNRWLIAATTAVALAVGSAYAYLAPPVYQSNLLIQVEDSKGGAASLLGEAASLFEVKTAASAEVEIIRSRMVIGGAVDETALYIEAQPRLLPVVGDWLARSAEGLSKPKRGYVYGKESISVSLFDVPADLEGTPFTLRVTGPGGDYSLRHPQLGEPLTGKVGQALARSVDGGSINLMVTGLQGLPGAEFELTRHSRLAIIENLQKQLKLAEKGRQSGVIDATLQDTDRGRLTRILNEIGEQYVRQNVERTAAEAKQTLAFLDSQMPQFKQQLTQSEEAYNRFRNQKGTVALDEEAKLILTRSVDLQAKQMEAQQKRRELLQRFTSEHPSIQTLDTQLAAWDREIASLNAQVKRLPAVQQDTVRLERDVKVNNALYEQLRRQALQLQLVREGKIGNVRVIDQAASPRTPVQPRKGITLGLALLLGLLGGVACAIARASLRRGVVNPQEIEAQTGVSVYSTIPMSELERSLAKEAEEKQPGLHLLAHTAPQDPAVESLRSLRTSLQFAMLEAPNNRLLITGATPGVGKSFVSANLAAVVASAGKRVLLIDADLRKGHLNQYFGIERSHGLSEMVAGSITVEQAVRRSVLPGMDFIPTGQLPPNPAELVMSGAFANHLEALSADYDMLIIDSAPILVAADTLTISALVGTLLLVARAGATQMGELHETTRRLRHAGRNTDGVLLNAMDLSNRHYGSYGSKYGGYRYRQYAYQLPNEKF